MQGRVTGSHLTSMHSMDNYYVSKLIPLIAEAQVSAIANPLINITLQGRHDTYPKRRGMTRVPELMAAGVDVAFGQDCMMDPWYGLGSADMLEVAHMGLHVAQMTGQDAMRACFRAVTATPAKILGLDGYGIEPGCHADLVLLQARDPIEAIRLRAARLAVIRRGQRLVAHATRGRFARVAGSTGDGSTFSTRLRARRRARSRAPWRAMQPRESRRETPAARCVGRYRDGRRVCRRDPCQMATCDGVRGDARHRHAFEHVEVDVLVMRSRRDRARAVRIPDHEIGIRTRR